MMELLMAYADQWSVRPGNSMQFMVSCSAASTFRNDIVRLTGPQLGANGPLFTEQVVDSPANGEYPARYQPVPAGSYVVVEDKDDRLTNLKSFTVQAFVWPTLPASNYQAILGTWSEQTESGFSIGISTQGHLELCLGHGDGRNTVVATDSALEKRHWYLVAASYDHHTREIFLYQIPFGGHRFVSHKAQRKRSKADAFSPGPAFFLIGAQHSATARVSSAWGELVAGAHYNGKIERPRVCDRVLDEKEIIDLAGSYVPSSLAGSVVAAWDFSQKISGVEVQDMGPFGLHGECVNLPARAMTGHNWTGVSADWTQAPHDYGAIHFHDDDIYDCRWACDFEVVLPSDLDSGIYAARLSSGDAQAYVVFFVRPARGAATSEVAYLAPTATYLAYANSFTYRWDSINEMINGALSVIDKTDLMQWEEPAIGLSAYDHHRDGSGVCYSSRLRPILNLRPTGRLWNFPIDLLIVNWLESTGVSVDILTDDDLHEEGSSLLDPYRVVVTASHPEYYSLSMLDATESWLRAGGRLMYMGGNGYYWRVAYHSHLPGVLEVRRAEAGIRTWAAEPGEYFMSFSAELGGLWQRQRRAPNLITGVGFVSQGFDQGSYYRRTDAANDARVAFVFKGVHDEKLGDFGLCIGGAASLEIDCSNADFGTPTHALVIAQSQMHTNTYELVPEEMLQSHPMTDASQNPHVRADMVFFETPNGGAVFSTGSIGYAGSLFENNYDNNIARITTNVLKRFIDPQPFDMP